MGGTCVSLTAATSLLVFLCAAPANAGPIARLTLMSETGDFVGQGGSFDITYTPTNSDSFFFSVFPFTPVPSFVDFALGTITAGPDDTFATLSFSTTQLGIAIMPGFYANAERALFAASGHPGLDVTFQGRGCGAVSGNFTINDATFSPDGLTIDTFSAQFEQRCDAVDAPALIGTFTFGPEQVPEPSVLLLFAFGLLLVGRRLRPAR